MIDHFNLYVGRFHEGKIEEIEWEVPPNFLDVTDGNNFFQDPVFISGKVYVAGSHLIVQVDIKTTYGAFCKICNEKIFLPLELNGIYLTEDLDSIPSKIYNIQESIREAILLELPLYNECAGGCTLRNEFETYRPKN
jgi:hypothetical protein